jgi:hypothetical protein
LLRNDREFHENEDTIFVHASYDPAQPMFRQSRQMLRSESVSPAKAVPHGSGKTVIAEHTRNVRARRRCLRRARGEPRKAPA